MAHAMRSRLQLRPTQAKLSRRETNTESWRMAPSEPFARPQVRLAHRLWNAMRDTPANHLERGDQRDTVANRHNHWVESGCGPCVLGRGGPEHRPPDCARASDEKSRVPDALTLLLGESTHPVTIQAIHAV
eukprot:CAMPEP_0206041696 /NCGR_PEP_ID=MMETSP1466-20131121/6117_1 /ASSEMBLY_ACC=CAM_ASM_001126 /TAXON_ID=44452 /ORGANISM="Pavlova gyrans, Strain CCMP608" /LENGTH=130 /DNA_ID=CAMNT_0053416399 /DNA_START=20 /DNA_END=412 /DNA_ORIENTATION=+